MPRNSRRKPRTPPDAPGVIASDFRGVIGVCALALYLSRFFVPAESAHLGHTLWNVQLWLLLGAFAAVDRLRAGRPLRPDARDFTVLLLVAGHVLAAGAVLLGEGQKRAALNMLWEWIGIGVAFWLLRNLARQPAGFQRLLAGIVVTAIVLSGLGVWQHYVWFPQSVERLLEYESLDTDDPAVVEHRRALEAELGVPTSDPTSTTYWVWRQRLTDSVEPIGRFALANTLAGVLAATLVLLAGMTWNAWRLRASHWRAGILFAACLLIVFCLILTKSRTAWMGCLVGLAVWAWRSAPDRSAAGFARRGLPASLRNVPWRVGGAVVFAIVALVVVAAISGGLDRFVFTEAPKSLQYRWEYWRSTLGVIRQAPVLGVGPGNFRQHYLAHKLPQSSEEILDPHNVFLDVWVHGGLLALLGLLLVLALAVRGLRTATTDAATTVRNEAGATTDSRLLAGGLLAFALLLSPVVLIGARLDWQLISLAVAWCLAALLFGRLPGQATIPHPAARAAGIALLVHLLGQGGIAMPVVGVTLLVLLLAGPQPAKQATGSSKGSRLHGVTGLAWAILLAAAAVTCLLTATRPVITSSAYLRAGRAEFAIDGNPAAARQSFRAAAEADPLDPEPWLALAQLEFALWERDGSPDAADFAEAMRHLQAAIERDPHSPKLHWLVGQSELQRYRRIGDARAAEEAVRWMRQAAAGYPHHAGIRADYALALAATGRPEDAREQAALALRLDDLNRELGHYDKLLSDQTRRTVETL